MAADDLQPEVEQIQEGRFLVGLKATKTSLSLAFSTSTQTCFPLTATTTTTTTTDDRRGFRRSARKQFKTKIAELPVMAADELAGSLLEDYFPIEDRGGKFLKLLPAITFNYITQSTTTILSVSTTVLNAQQFSSFFNNLPNGVFTACVAG
ncbi:uncharacterized protein LOC108667604 [Hyalella azteca]|uniref:Uncharacterized protein LOC108667604 n=1 Tax=Hyalella azteca TaxID=294128 RepID=A0A8B7N8A4_HYAAZ|nr:uncharacterized protein LOC108667604 [Hyalella azteca]